MSTNTSSADPIKSYKVRLKEYQERLKGARNEAEQVSLEQAIEETKRKLKTEEEAIKPHPALQFGPISQTVAIMSAISLAMSVVRLPGQMMPFYQLFSRLTIMAVIGLVSYTSLIYYGYTQALSHLPKPDKKRDLYDKLKAMSALPERADLWAHTRSHPSAFLTTRQAGPKIFPFPLGKSRADATVKDELWWEGGNAPHVRHFNRPRLPEPGEAADILQEKLYAKVEASMDAEKQRNLWKKRIRSIQALSIIVVIAFISRPLALLSLIYLIYMTLSTEIHTLLSPPAEMASVHNQIRAITEVMRNQSAPKADARKGISTGGMTYILDPVDAMTVKPVADIPINIVPPHVLMTSENGYYAGPGEQLKDPNR